MNFQKKAVKLDSRECFHTAGPFKLLTIATGHIQLTVVCVQRQKKAELGYDCTRTQQPRLNAVDTPTSHKCHHCATSMHVCTCVYTQLLLFRTKGGALLDVLKIKAFKHHMKGVESVQSTGVSKQGL